MKISVTLVLLVLLTYGAFSQTGSINEPVRFVGGTTIDPNVQEGRLRYAIGTESRQVLRANRTNPGLAEGYGWTYNHAPDLCYWNNTFYLEYLSNPVDEHISPGQTLVVTSADGRNWNKPVVVFPPYKAPAGVKIPEGYEGYMMHQRMGFYIAPNGRLLVLAFYGHSEDPFEEGGIGRVVREAYTDGTFGPIYFIRYSSHTSWNETNTAYPFYTKSKDRGFVEACSALLADKLKTMQWWDEDKGLDGFYANKEAGSAFNYYHRKDGKVTGLWKRSLCALSDDGIYFSKPVKAPTLTMPGGKMWGQATEDGRYALCYNPIELDEYRYPLIIITGDDGIIYDNMLLVQGEVPPRRFMGRWKDFGPCYMRGILEGNGNPPGNDMWLTYSMNKEDIWISRIQVPVTYSVTGNINENFNNLKSGESIPSWNIYSPKWAPVEIAAFPSFSDKSICLSDQDPYDYSRAVRVFQESSKADISFRILAGKPGSAPLEIDVNDQFGNRPVRLTFGTDGYLKASDGSKEIQVLPFKPEEWYEIRLTVDGSLYGSYSLVVNGTECLKGAALSEAVKSVERISFRTGAFRTLPGRHTPNQDPAPPLPGADEQVSKSVYYLDDIKIVTE
jgi:hypothetical protein